jgi:indole-3-glycerol phosphate synthase/phosphoribosylanthranilate isomerase
MAETILERIVAATRADLAERQVHTPLDVLRQRAAVAPAPRPFAEALRPVPGGPARLIAEIKRASPSKGLLAADFDPVAQAKAYAAGGTAAVSVLTEPHFFLGALEHLSAVGAAVDVPLLRKDFIVDSYQVYEARAAGADALLLICALLDDAALSDLLGLARSLGMEALVEAHDAAEVRRAVAVGARVVGVNSRDLKTFAVDTDIVRHLRPLVPSDRVFVAESGIADWVGAARARAWGADAILVGEALMRAADPAAQSRKLADAAGGTTAYLLQSRRYPYVKLCGLTRSEHVAAAARLGADAFGLVFAPSRRRVTIEQARDLTQVVSAGSPDSGSDESRRMRAFGVFVNEPPDTIAAIARESGLGGIQLSGDEPPERCAEVAAHTGLPVVKALRIREEADLALLDAYALAGMTLLLDTLSPSGEYGGTGKIGNWDLARCAAERWPVILSGGLTPANVAEALRHVVPAGVDVSSGIETDGAKDEGKMRAFVTAVEAAKMATGDSGVVVEAAKTETSFTLRPLSPREEG